MMRRRDPNQGSLFGDDSDSEELTAAPTNPALQILREALHPSVRLGTSSWSFPGWRGLIWGGPCSTTQLAQDGLRCYAKHPLLRTVGIDKTYYRPAPREEYARLRAQVSDDFRFLVKAHEAVTRQEIGASSSHQTTTTAVRFLDPGYAVNEVIHPVMEGLGASAGPILFQFSPMGVRSAKSAEAFTRRLGVFLRACPVGPLYAVEVRDRALMRPSWAAMLRDTGVSHSYGVHPTMPPPLVQAQTVDPAGQPAIVCRWMLHAGLGYQAAVDRYEPFNEIVDADPSSREQFARLCSLAISHGKDSWVIINNKAEGSAPRSVELLARALGRTDGLLGA